MAGSGKKKVVKVETTPEAEAADSGFKPTAEAKGKATRNRVIALILWVLAIGGEAFAIFWVLRRPLENGSFPTWAWILLLGLLVVIGLLTFFGGQLWKQANRLDPASKANPVRFFVQNQLGAIITIIAFVPLIILIFLNKDLDGKQKGIAGAVGIVLLLVAGFFSTSITPPSTEQYDSEAAQVIKYTGENNVFWTKFGSVFHLCSDASAVNQESSDATIYSGTVAAAHEAGKERLTKQIDLELEQCGLDTTLNDDDAPVVEEPTETETPAA